VILATTVLMGATTWGIHLPAVMAFAAIATLGYIVGCRRRQEVASANEQGRRELRRARGVASELETIAEAIRKNLAIHRASVGRFKERVMQLSNEERDSAWRELCDEAEEVLKPTLRLATQISQAYDEIRQQSNNLVSFTEVHTDPLTGVCNRRALEDALRTRFALMYRYEQPFSIIILDIDHFKRINDERGHVEGDRTLQEMASLLDETVRETDLVARYGGEEFVVVIPQTDLQGGTIFAERIRQLVERKLEITVSGGVATALEGDTPETLVARADAAVYSAKADGRNRIYLHDGLDVASVTPQEAATERHHGGSALEGGAVAEPIAPIVGELSRDVSCEMDAS